MTHIGQGCWTASCSRIHCGFLTQGPETPSAWCGADPQIGDVRGRQYRSRPMEHDDHQVWRRCRKPTRLQLSLWVAALRTESSDTLYSGVAQPWTLWCGASSLPPRGRSHQRRLADELPENLSTKNPSLDVGVAGTRPHDAHHSQLASSSGHSEWPDVAPSWWASEVVGVGHHHVEHGHVHFRQIP
jgi:hypothetical protein